ncbi:MAG: flagellar biosynthetic protein FliR [Oscillospiraceae bacterium]|nr:flagellar biosynthetic protein FliR [Oscillospiraceae bacterium]
MTIGIEGMAVYIAVFARLAGLVLFNPLLSRRNVPTMVRMGFVLLLTILLAPLQPATALANTDAFGMVFVLFTEFFMGYLCGFVYQIFYYLLLFAGDWMDTEFGMSMAKVFDPSTSIQMSITGTLLTLLFTLYLFATDSHLVLIQLFAMSFKIVPIGGVTLSPEAYQYALQLFVEVFSLALRLIMPFTIVEFSLQIVMGIMMKLVPQIHVFVINFQLKQGVGLIMLFLLGPTIGAFIDNYIIILLENIQRAMQLLA